MTYKNNPIIIIGSGRSGSTIIFEAIAHHSDLAWLSQYYYPFKKIPRVGFIHRFFNKIGEKPQGQNLKFYNQLIPRPLEVFPVWEYLVGSKFRYSSLITKIATLEEKYKCRKYFYKLVKSQNKKRLCIKVTGPPRLNYLASIFPNAIFIDVVRNPFAVVASLLNINFWIKRGIESPHWDNLFTQSDYDRWKFYNNSSVALAALEWRRIFKRTKKEVLKNNNIYFRIKYENFVDNPQKKISSILKLSKLKNSKKISCFLKKKHIRNMNYKYKERLTEEEKKVIKNICYREIKELNYQL